MDLRTDAGRTALERLRRKLGFDEGLVAAGAVGKDGRTPAQAVADILADVRGRGDAAVLEAVRRFDGVDLTADRLEVTPAELQAARGAADPAFLATVRRIAGSIRRYQTDILPRQPADRTENGLTTGIRLRPMERAGVYIPGGAGSYPSSVLMTVVPAQVAGVREIILCTPPLRGQGGAVRAEVLAVAAELGVSRVFRVGGVQAVGALAFGTATIPAVDKIVGPGNLFVTLAKKQVYGQVDIDGLAGPSEVLVIADDTADADCVAADMLAQAEHDPGSALLLTPSEGTAGRVRASLAAMLPGRARRAALERALAEYSAVAVTRDLDEAVALSNRFAPEHLSVQTADARGVAGRCVNAGAVFVGKWSPVAFGDYVAGPSHVLPTGGTARFASGLTSGAFLKSSSWIEYAAEGAAAAGADARFMAGVEGFEAHGHSVAVRGQG